MLRFGRGFLYALGFTSLLALLVAAGLAPEFPWIAAALIGGVALAVVFFALLMPGSRTFAIGLANGLAVYACLYVYLLEANFDPVPHWLQAAGFLAPVLGFLASAALQLDRIRAILATSQPRSGGHPGRIFFWLMPMALVAGVTFLVPRLPLDDAERAMVFAAAMLVVALVVAVLSRQIAIFLLDSALLFDQLFRRIGRLVTAAFAFLSLYSLLVIAFGAIYRVLDFLSDGPQFTLGGVLRDLSFSEALYFSLVTLATLGYGDVVPISAAARILVAVQTVTGLLLLLFGFAEIQRALREREEHGPRG